MVKDLFGGKETSKERATRMWRNNALRTKYKERKAPIVAKEAPQPADVIENEGRKAHGFERKFLKDIRTMMNEHKSMRVEWYKTAIDHQRRRLLKEKIRRLELSIAEREGRS